MISQMSSKPFGLPDNMENKVLIDNVRKIVTIAEHLFDKPADIQRVAILLESGDAVVKSSRKKAGTDDHAEPKFDGTVVSM